MEEIIITRESPEGRRVRLMIACFDLDLLCKQWPAARRRWAKRRDANTLKEAFELAQRFAAAGKLFRDNAVPEEGES